VVRGAFCCAVLTAASRARAVSNLLRPGTFGGESRAPPAAVQRSVIERASERGPASLGAPRRAEIFVDIVERLTVVFNSAGYVLTTEIDGSIQCKSFLQGNPQVRPQARMRRACARHSRRVADPAGAERGPHRRQQRRLAARRRARRCVALRARSFHLVCLTLCLCAALGVVLLDDATFHEGVNVDSFEVDRSLVLTPPSGEFTAMSYRVSSAEFTPPFRVVATVSEPAPFKVEVLLRLRAEFPARHSAAGVTLRLPLPRCTSHASLSLGGGAPGATAPPGQAVEYDDARKEVVWTLRKCQGGSEHTLRVRATLTQERAGALRREVGPATLAFTIPSFNVSRLAVRYLQLMQRPQPGEAPPARWVRYITTSSSYVCRF
jgi:AP-4 complex subunit mu-1